MIARVQVKNFVAIPTKAETHIQNMAPGPPVPIANATPLILPRPTVAAIAEDKACKEVISPAAPGSSYFPPTTFMACLNPLKGMNPEKTSIKNPPPIKSSNKGVPQIQLLNLIISSPKFNISFYFDHLISIVQSNQ
jgi:hypothetical protein